MFADALLLLFIVGQRPRTLVCFLHVLHYSCVLIGWERHRVDLIGRQMRALCRCYSVSIIYMYYTYMYMYNTCMYMYMYICTHMCVCHSGTYTCTCTVQELLWVHLVSTSSAMHRFRVLLSLIANKAVILSVMNNLSYCLCTWTFCKYLSKGH